MAYDEEQEDIAMHRLIKAAMRAYRQRRGWNQQQMAAFLHITKENYQKYEYYNPKRKLTKVPMVVAIRFAEYTEQNLHDLTQAARKRANG
jgi:DNA-binding XRE family transcriptional regulator